MPGVDLALIYFKSIALIIIMVITSDSVLHFPNKSFGKGVFGKPLSICYRVGPKIMGQVSAIATGNFGSSEITETMVIREIAKGTPAFPGDSPPHLITVIR